MIPEHYDVVVVGGGPAGLAMSYFLTRQGRRHIVLEQGRIAEAWRTRRWDSLRLIVPNWHLAFAGQPYAGDDPDGFMHRDEVVMGVEAYARSFGARVRCDTAVTRIEPAASGAGFLLRATGGMIEGRCVVIATGAYQHLRIPLWAAGLPGDLHQVPATHYRNPSALPEGGVLVVGCGLTGGQIAEELRLSGRQVYVAVGTHVWLPRRYRGKDIFWWATQMGTFDQPLDQAPAGQAKRGIGARLYTGQDGGRDLNLHTLARDGVVLLGRLEGAAGTTFRFAPDLRRNIEAADAFAREFCGKVDAYIERTGIGAPEERCPIYTDAFRTAQEDPVLTVDLRQAGIRTVVWAMGYRPDFGWIDVPVFDADGHPIHRRGVTPYPGLYFLGLEWLSRLNSSLFPGIPGDAEHLAAVIGRTPDKCG